MDVTDDTQLKIEPVKVENKITEKRLKDRVLLMSGSYMRGKTIHYIG